MQKCLEQIADVVDPKPSDDASTMVKLNWADRRRHMQAMLVEQVKNVVADRNRSLYQFAGAIKGGWREAVASTLDELVKALPDDRRTYRGVRSRAERLASELRGPDLVAQAPLAEDDARAFLVSLVDGARQGDRLPAIMARVAERLGWTAEDAFALAESLSAPRAVVTWPPAQPVDAQAGWYTFQPTDPVDIQAISEALRAANAATDRRAVLVTVDRQDVTMEWVSLLHEALRRSGVYPIPSLETFTLDEARKLVTFVRLAPGVGAGAQSGETSDGGGL